MIRRCVLIRLESTCEQPENRHDFEHPDLIDWVNEHRAQLVVAGLTLLQGWGRCRKTSTGNDALGRLQRLVLLDQESLGLERIT